MRDASWWSFFISFVVTLAALFAVSIFLPDIIKHRKAHIKKLDKIFLYYTDSKGENLFEVVMYDKIEGSRVEFLFEKLLHPPSGYYSPVPKGTRLISWEKRGNILTLNFSKELVENHPGGASSEAATVYGIVNTFVKNIPAIHMVEIKVEGKSMDTLKGHVYIKKPIKFTGNAF